MVYVALDLFPVESIIGSFPTQLQTKLKLELRMNLDSFVACRYSNNNNDNNNNNNNNNNNKSNNNNIIIIILIQIYKYNTNTILYVLYVCIEECSDNDCTIYKLTMKIGE